MHALQKILKQACTSDLTHRTAVTTMRLKFDSILLGVAKCLRHVEGLTIHADMLPDHITNSRLVLPHLHPRKDLCVARHHDLRARLSPINTAAITPTILYRSPFPTWLIDIFRALKATTLAAHDFDIDTRTGFLPPEVPVSRLPEQWESWEVVLYSARQRHLVVGDKTGITADEAADSEAWRTLVREMPILDTTGLKVSERLLRRAHHVMAWIMHFYIHSLPPTAEVVIPASITIPHLQICVELDLPPVLTYSDDVLYNWTLPESETVPTVENLRTQTLFTGTCDEEEFYLTSARIELCGVAAIFIMCKTVDEASRDSGIATCRITAYLRTLARNISDMRDLLLGIKKGCRPDIFYNDIRPWFRGADSDRAGRKWVFDGVAESGVPAPAELSGASAGQSSLIHALDIFLGVERHTHDASLMGHANQTQQTRPFLSRMQTYMPRQHRAFLTHLSANPRPLRALVLSAEDEAMRKAYDDAVRALKEFRDAHLQIVAMYIVGPARRSGAGKHVQTVEQHQGQAIRGPTEKWSDEARPLKGTGGSDVIEFLKNVRDRTEGALIEWAAGKAQGVSEA